ncbi:MAG: serine hydrolase domain-containing protein [Terracidiphilus sp.]|jgi:CubicO group peptidase (beta-lactamase class C family)
MPIRTLLLLLAVACSAAAQSSAPNAAPPIAVPKDAPEQIGKIFSAFNHTDTPGCAVGVSLAGNKVWHAAYGMADLEQHVALTPYSVFEAGSVSKQFTAAAVLLLAEQGKLSLTDPISKYFPELPDYGTPITIDHLMHHTSGLRDWGSVEAVAGWPRTTRVYSNTWVLDIAAHQKELNYKPGDEWSYTNTGYNLLAILVERVSGKSLAQFTHDNIFVPLGMQTTSWRDDFQRIVPNRAIAYEETNGVQHQLMPFENAYGNGGLLTTVDDLLRWNDRYLGSKIGDSTFVKSELVPGKLNDGRSLFYSAGLFITAHNGAREISHSGATAGYSTWLGYYPSQQLSVAVLCSEAGTNATNLGHKVVDVYLPPSAADQAAAAGKNNVTLVPDSVGLYESSRNHVAFTIERKDGKLIARGHYPIIAISATSFQLMPESTTYELGTDASGKVTAMRAMQMGYVADIFDKVERARPTQADMQAMTGDYVSDDAEATLKVVLPSKGLEIHEGADTVYPLKPTYADGFECELGSIRFLKDAGGHFNEMSVSDSRLWDLRLKRVETK